jgi:hypothetical protein
MPEGSASSYPWYERTTGRDLEQGDILKACPLFEIVSDNSLQAQSVQIRRLQYDVVVISQTCDLAHGKLRNALLCRVFPLSSLPAELSSKRQREKIREGVFPNLHMLHACTLEGITQEISVVDFREVYSLPVDFAQAFAMSVGDRPRILPPYKEHLSQGFARFFMRVGLPSTIPADAL